MSYLYDAASRRTRMTWPDAFYVTYDYDVSNAVTVATAYAYDAASRLQTLTQDLPGATPSGARDQRRQQLR